MFRGIAACLAIALAFACAPAVALIQPYMPPAMETAPVERAISNVADDESLSDAQRERILGRLHLIAAAQAGAHMTRFANGEWRLRGEGPCGDRAYGRAPPGGAACPFGYAGLEATPELPNAPLRTTAAARAHLRSAREHYERSLELDDADLRAHLGLAYVLDQTGDDEAARAQLRHIIKLGVPMLANPPLPEQPPHREARPLKTPPVPAGSLVSEDLELTIVDWEVHAVLLEAVGHLGGLAQTEEDREAVQRLRAQLGEFTPSYWITPIVVPLADVPFAQLIDPASPVAFDFAGTGDTRAQGWLTPDAAWLVWDPEHRGDIRSGFDLIGQRTWAVFWTDGFEAMRSLDDNRDGELAGPELGGLALWRDADSDGVSDAGEVLPLASHGVAGLAVRGAQERPDLIVALTGVRLSDGRTRPLYDWTPGLGSAPNS